MPAFEHKHALEYRENCERCKEHGIGYNDDGQFLCEDCLFDDLSRLAAREEIRAERRRQIEVEGWTPEHDDQHTDGSLLSAATQYHLSGIGAHLTMRDDGAPVGWRWDAKWWKPKGPQTDLVRAGALCLAEIDRLRRKRRESYTGHVEERLNKIVTALASLPEHAQ